jgi:hypothetical protein
LSLPLPLYMFSFKTHSFILGTWYSRMNIDFEPYRSFSLGLKSMKKNWRIPWLAIYLHNEIIKDPVLPIFKLDYL